MYKKNYFSKSRKIRILSGKWKGYKIPVPTKNLVRPTTSKTRETLFNWISPVIYNSICLDCFTGTGALGLEALSRGAKQITFIDHNYICINALTKIIYKFQAVNNSKIIHSDCRKWLIRQSECINYNIIFIDPPFQQHTIILEILILLEKYNHFSEQSWIYIETSKHQKLTININKLSGHWLLHKQKTTSSTAYFLYFRNIKT